MSASWRWLSVGVVALIVAACTPKFGKKPIYSAHVVGGNCTSTTYVDSNGVRKSESGCEARSSGTRTKQLSTERLAKIRAAFAALPADPKQLEGCFWGKVTVAITRVDGSRKEWAACRGGRYKEAPPPVGSAAAALW